MRYYVEQNGKTIEIDFDDKNDRVIARVDGEEMVVDLRKIADPSLFSLILDNRSYEVFIEEQDGEQSVLIEGELHRMIVQDEWTRRLANIQRKGKGLEGDLQIRAPMPGVVLTIDVAAGDRVSEGMGLVTLGAMKMENEIKAPRGGVVRQVHVEQGQTVEQGRVLLVLG
jgi:biotin carboxyl carrier protein